MRSPRATVVAGFLTLALGAVGCGVPIDDGPRALSVTARPDDRPASASGDSSTFLYYVRDAKLIPTRRDVPEVGIRTVLDALLEDVTPEDLAMGLVSQIPAGTRIRNLSENNLIILVDLSPEFEDVIGVSRQQAIAQVVFTLTEVEHNTEFRFLIDGTPLKVSSPIPSRGDVEQVSECDFVSLLPSRDDLREAGLLGTDSASRVAQRRASLQRCPGTEAAASPSEEPPWPS